MSDSISSISATTAEQTQAITMQIMQMTQQKLQGEIAMKLIQSAVQTGGDFQDPSTVTSAQLQSPIDLRI